MAVVSKRVDAVAVGVLQPRAQAAGSQSPEQPSSDWKLPGATAITELLLSVTQCVLWS